MGVAAALRGRNEQQVEDLRTAVRYIRRHAARYRVDPGRIAIFGESASGQMVSPAQVRTTMANTLIQAELNRQIAAKEHLSYDTTTLRNVMAQFESVVSQVPKADQARFRDVVEDIYRGQLQIYTKAQSELSAQGVEEPRQDQVDKEISAMQQK